MQFQVHCGMRPICPRGFPAYVSTSTMFRTVTVYADSVQDAQLKAIAECYRQWNDVEHVKPGKVTPIVMR